MGAMVSFEEPKERSQYGRSSNMSFVSMSASVSNLMDNKRGLKSR